MTPKFDESYKRILNEIIMPKYKRVKHETFGARYTDNDSSDYTGSRSTQKEHREKFNTGLVVQDIKNQQHDNSQIKILINLFQC